MESATHWLGRLLREQQHTPGPLLREQQPYPRKRHFSGGFCLARALLTPAEEGRRFAE